MVWIKTCGADVELILDFSGYEKGQGPGTRKPPPRQASPDDGGQADGCGGTQRLLHHRSPVLTVGECTSPFFTEWLGRKEGEM